MYGYGFGWAWMALMPLVWLGFAALLVWAAVRLIGASQRGGPGWETPEQILDRRYASGEIDAEAYAEARARLAGSR